MPIRDNQLSDKNKNGGTNMAKPTQNLPRRADPKQAEINALRAELEKVRAERGSKDRRGTQKA